MLLLLAQGKDIEQFRCLIKKLRKENDSLIWPGPIWKLAYESQFKLLSSAFPCDGSIKLAGSMLKKDFDFAAPLIEAKFSSAEVRESGRVIILLCASELYKLNDGAVDSEPLRLLLVDVYATLFIEFGGEEMKVVDSRVLLLIRTI
jgi:hypothetical protein